MLYKQPGILYQVADYRSVLFVECRSEGIGRENKASSHFTCTVVAKLVFTNECFVQFGNEHDAESFDCRPTSAVRD